MARPIRGAALSDSRAAALPAMLELRRSVLAELGAAQARVLEVYTGKDGQLYDGAWKQAAACTAIGPEWVITDPRRRYVGDSLRILRNIQLAPYTVFDVDADGQPWPALLIVLKRRQWLPGERGAVVMTECTIGSEYGQTSKAVTELTGLVRQPSGAVNAEHTRRLCVQHWLERAGVKLDRCWEAVSKRGATGARRVVYSALVFSRGQVH